MPTCADDHEHSQLPPSSAAYFFIIFFACPELGYHIFEFSHTTSFWGLSLLSLFNHFARLQ
uniref:Uncharacterized protein n=1 Tax=Arion vulgaris TaxID=1028688 RepID=A0A0B7AS16_9EUPU